VRPNDREPSVKLEEFREEVRREFGDRLQRATPANVQDFLARMQSQLFLDTGKGDQGFELNETASDYNEIVTQFFARVLQAKPEQLEEALMMLWLVGFELHFARLEEEYADRFAAMFHEGEEDEES
jgi:hypothetical protein